MITLLNFANLSEQHMLCYFLFNLTTKNINLPSIHWINSGLIDVIIDLLL